MRILTPIYCLLLACTFFCISAHADFTEDFESHAIGTPLMDIGFLPFGGYENLTIQNVGTSGSKGFESFPMSSDNGFPRFALAETGTTQIGDRIRSAIDVRIRNGNLGFGDSQTVIDFQINNPVFDQMLIGAIQRTGEDNEDFRLLLFETVTNSVEFSEAKNYSAFGLESNVPGEWTDWLRFEINVWKTGQATFDVLLTVSDIQGNLLLQLDKNNVNLLGAVESDIYLSLGHTFNTFRVASQLGFDNFSYDMTPENTNTLEPDSYNTIRGDFVAGDLADVLQSDDSYLQFNPGFTINSSEPPVWLEFESQTAPQKSSALKVAMESNGNTPGLTQEIELYNWSTSQYDLIDSFNVSFNFDRIRARTIANAANYLQSGMVSARCGWRKTGFTIVYPWSVSIDQLGWTVFE